jgi:hypothetical protein
MQAKYVKKSPLKPSPQFIPVGNQPPPHHLLLPFPAHPPSGGDMAKPPPRQRQRRPPLISKQGAPSTGRLINTPLDVFDGKCGNPENYMTEFAPRNGRNCRTQTTPDSMATPESRPNVDTWMTHQLNAVKRTPRVKDPMAENEDNLRIDFVTGPQNVSTKATKRPDAYN